MTTVPFAFVGFTGLYIILNVLKLTFLSIVTFCLEPNTCFAQYLFKSAYALHQSINCIHVNKAFSFSESADLMPPYDLDLSLVSGISSRLVFTCQLALSWCTGKLHQFLTTWNVKSYLFVACTDLKVIC